MYELNSLVGENLEYASKILKEKGYNEIEVITNSKPDGECNQKLVCGVRKNGNKITLIIGDFVIKD